MYELYICVYVVYKDIYCLHMYTSLNVSYVNVLYVCVCMCSLYVLFAIMNGICIPYKEGFDI